jgi:hypothetical protein
MTDWYDSPNVTILPRCCHPMQDYNLDRLRAYVPAAVCWRPDGHPGKHRSHEAYLYAREQKLKRKHRG